MSDKKKDDGPVDEVRRARIEVLRCRRNVEDRAAMDALEQLRHAGEDQETNAASVMEDALNYLWSKLYDGTTDWEYPGQVANHALEAIREQTERADAAEAKAKALGEALREAQWAIRTLRDASQPGSSPLSAAETARIHTALREAGMEEAPEPAMHYDSSGRPMHHVSECRPGVCWTDEPAPADLILKPLPRTEPERSKEATRRAEEMKRLLSRGDGEEG